MRLRNWLLTGTSIGMLAMLPVAAHAQDGELIAVYQEFTTAQASGDADATAAAQAKLTEACIVYGYASFEECVAALEAAVAAAAAEPAPAEPEPAVEPAPEPEPAPVVEPAPEPAPAIDITADLQAQVDAYNAAVADIEAGGDRNAALGQIASAQDGMAQLCANAGYGSLDECLATYGLGLAAIPPEPAPEPVAAPEPAPEPAPVVEPTPEPAPAVDITADLQAQVDAYNAAVADIEAGGDRNAALAQIASAQDGMSQLCANDGYGSLEECLADYGMALSEVPAEQATEVAPEPAPQADPAVDITADLQAQVDAYNAAVADIEAGGDRNAALAQIASAQDSMTQLCTNDGYGSLEECLSDYSMALSEVPAEQAPAVDPAANATVDPAPVEVDPTLDITADLQVQVDAYNAAVADMMAGGDMAASQARMAEAEQAIAALCAQVGETDVTTCLSNYGLALPTVPNMGQPDPAIAPAVVDPTQPVEIIQDLPQGITQEQVAPVLDSAKDPAQPVAGDAQVAPVAEAPAEPAPTTDADAQSRFQAMEAVAPVAEEQGVMVQATALEPQVVPQNVTIINQTNVINNTVNNTTNNTTNNTVNNNTTINNVIVDNSQTNIGQQNNVAINQTTVQPLDPGQAITQVILQVGTQLIVNSVGQDTDRFYNAQEDEIFYENLSNGRVRETITRPDGSQIITVRNRNGDILRRSRIDADGREYVLAYFDDRYDTDLDTWRDPGLDLPPLRLNIPVRDYVLDAEYADERQVQVFFEQPPVEQVARLYSIDEVKRSARIRDSVRKLEVGGLTFDSGRATIGRDQVGSLSTVANAMLELLARNPGETFLIEGHTDAVGSEISNLQLSDLRAATVARILTDFYGVPPENLATQGYGERYLKIRTEQGERENRRVTIRRITPLITVANTR
ncbi:OmpA family protein [Devosia sp. FKR38]|uniref:OmpA family protein n=1 Tax=Devosia sp. FKR38 TaxID=2562312 RepID=UPI0020BE8401|nr:OmpA family protein [Devosia sp. FKR38]